VIEVANEEAAAEGGPTNVRDKGLADLAARQRRSKGGIIEADQK
jgi:hypothetical protein